MRLADEKSKCVSLQSRPLRSLGNLVGPNGAGPVSGCKLPFIKCINHYSLINSHFSSETDGVKCVHGSAWQKAARDGSINFQNNSQRMLAKPPPTPPLPRRGNSL